MLLHLRRASHIPLQPIYTYLFSLNETLYTCKITFIKATSVPVADFNDLSCDPYLQATLTAEKGLEQPDGIPQMLTYRTQTCRRMLDPEFNAHWVVSGIPQSGFLLSVRLRDEDPGSYDDDLGKAVLRMPNAGEGVLSESWRSGDREYKGGRCVPGTLVGPRKYIRYFSPLIDKFLSSSNSPDSGDRNAVVKPTVFVANRPQLAGPVPSLLHHRYAGFTPFVKAMFRKRDHTLYKQPMEIYKWDKTVA
ncbi:uncharacterized protein PHACADRAFT_202459 [Phanerochaete carnosa HHB-10118-sp]|uniref:C2 domain-containing protein n=1 Tax=Phanerochaete carnosa (strain HHB-10118-sp) TaxID=650164 RepID=K5VPU6_PHACS|nr:uncharacterized protein PHACADRAFT_202459 [Phanerochaete carnosa HHB-10118-sp]EKM48740.1 hypothetical protein PHACADRAFT_202459 [Phanerochaete carnosa HHB-10118-sp]